MSRSIKLSQRGKNLVAYYNALAENVGATETNEHGREVPAPLPVPYGKLCEIANRSFMFDAVFTQLTDECLTESTSFGNRWKPGRAPMVNDNWMQHAGGRHVVIKSVEPDNIAELKQYVCGDNFIDNLIKGLGIGKSKRSKQRTDAKRAEKRQDILAKLEAAGNHEAIEAYKQKWADQDERRGDFAAFHREEVIGHIKAFQKRLAKMKDEQPRKVHTWESTEGCHPSHVDNRAIAEGVAMNKLALHLDNDLDAMQVPNQGERRMPKPSIDDLKRRYRGKWKNHAPGKYQYKKHTAIKAWLKIEDAYAHQFLMAKVSGMKRKYSLEQRIKMIRKIRLSAQKRIAKKRVRYSKQQSYRYTRADIAKRDAKRLRKQKIILASQRDFIVKLLAKKGYKKAKIESTINKVGLQTLIMLYA